MDMHALLALILGGGAVGVLTAMMSSYSEIKEHGNVNLSWWDEKFKTQKWRDKLAADIKEIEDTWIPGWQWSLEWNKALDSATTWQEAQATCERFKELTYPPSQRTKRYADVELAPRTNHTGANFGRVTFTPEPEPEPSQSWSDFYKKAYSTDEPRSNVDVYLYSEWFEGDEIVIKSGNGDICTIESEPEPRGKPVAKMTGRRECQDSNGYIQVYACVNHDDVVASCYIDNSATKELNRQIKRSLGQRFTCPKCMNDKERLAAVHQMSEESFTYESF